MAHDKGDTVPEGPADADRLVVRLLRTTRKSGKKDNAGNAVTYKAVSVAVYEKGSTEPIWEGSAPKALQLVGAIERDSSVLERIRTMAEKAPRSAAPTTRQIEIVGEAE